MSPKQLRVLRHALGLDHKGHGKPYRRHYCCGPGHDGFDACRELEVAEAAQAYADADNRINTELERVRGERDAMAVSLEHAQSWAKQETKSRDAMLAERDLSRARVAVLEGALVEARDMIRACNGWHMSTAESLAERIDALLAGEA